MEVTPNIQTVLESRYLERDAEGNIIETPEKLFRRVANHVASAEVTDAEARAEEFFQMMWNQEFMPNSPTLMNAGRRLGMLSACFVLPLDDSIEDIMDTARQIALIQRAGGGTGISLGQLRPSGAIVKSSGGSTSGPIPFLKMLSGVTDAIQQGAFRRGANMAVMPIDHPDVIEFIKLKSDLTQITNYNVSVGITDAFMTQLEEAPNSKWWFTNPHDGKGAECNMTVAEIWDLICECAHATGEPGLIFLDRIEGDNPTPHKFKVQAVNPCVAGDTPVLTQAGFRPIESLVGETVSVWNGHRWTIVTPRVTGRYQEMLKIRFSDGSTLRCTKGHKFHVRKYTRDDLEIIEAQDLEVGQNLDRFHFPVVEGGRSVDLKHAYTQGFFAGDGWQETDRGRQWIGLYGEKRELADQIEHTKNYECPSTSNRHMLEVSGLESKTFVPMEWSVPARLEWLAGLCDSDGNVQRKDPQDMPLIQITSVDRDFLMQTKQLLHTLGADASVRPMKAAGKKLMPDGKGGEKEYDTQECFRLLISPHSTWNLRQLGFRPRRIELGDDRPEPIRRYVVKVESIEEDGIADEVFCFTDPLDHKGLFGSVSTGQCGEEPLGPYESCTLGSINLAAFYDEGTEDISYVELKRVIHSAVRFLDNVVTVNKYPTPELAEAAHANRKIGLGVMGWADLLFKMRVRYDSEEALGLANELGAFIQAEAHRASRLLALERGNFPNWVGSVWQREETEMRNARCITIAPTGTISIIAGCSGGIEPIFRLAFERNVLDGKRMVEVNDVLKEQDPEAAEMLEGGHPISSISDLPNHFVTADQIDPEWHVRMQAAWQEHTDAAVSKTINLPASADVEAVNSAYRLAFETGCKGITVYRDGSRDAQPMAELKTEEFVSSPTPEKPILSPAKAPAELDARRLRQGTPFGNLHVFVTEQDGRPVEVFAQLGRAGHSAAADLEGMCRMASLWLRAGGELSDVIHQLAGIGSNHAIPQEGGPVRSLPDALARALTRYAEGEVVAQDVEPGYSPACPECGADVEFTEGCQMCSARCGWSKC